MTLNIKFHEILSINSCATLATKCLSHTHTQTDGQAFTRNSEIVFNPKHVNPSKTGSQKFLNETKLSELLYLPTFVVTSTKMTSTDVRKYWPISFNVKNNIHEHHFFFRAEGEGGGLLMLANIIF